MPLRVERIVSVVILGFWNQIKALGFLFVRAENWLCHVLYIQRDWFCHFFRSLRYRTSDRLFPSENTHMDPQFRSTKTKKGLKPHVPGSTFNYELRLKLTELKVSGVWKTKLSEFVKSAFTVQFNSPMDYLRLWISHVQGGWKCQLNL